MSCGCSVPGCGCEQSLGATVEIDNALLTGSRVYGVPSFASDVDLVVLMDPTEAVALAVALGVEIPESDRGSYPTIQFEIGGDIHGGHPLNLILESERGKFEAWKTGTAWLKKIGPVTRQYAVDYFKQLFSEFEAKKES